MGQITLVWFAALALLGLALVITGAVTRRGLLLWSGISLLVSLAATWGLGPAGLFAGIFVLGGSWMRRKKDETS